MPFNNCSVRSDLTNTGLGIEVDRQLAIYSEFWHSHLDFMSLQIRFMHYHIKWYSRIPYYYCAK